MEQYSNTRTEIAMKRLFLYEEYFASMDKVESLLADCRSSMAKARNVIGFSLDASGHLDQLSQLDPTIWIECGCDEPARFLLSHMKHSESNANKDGLRKRQQESKTDEKNDADTKRSDDEQKATKESPPVFRPFGILEPQSAKIARNTIKSLLPLLCDLANLRSQIRELDSKIVELATKKL